MATDVEVQFFSHLNGLTLGNNWGDLIRLLDKTLVTGVDFTQITSATMNDQGDVIINLYSAHNAMLFQIVELTGFLPSNFNQKYRIKGVPSATQLILKPKTSVLGLTIANMGAAKLASMGYDIIFRDTADVKRVYRAKNPTVQHPFIRVDESLASDTGGYTSAYAKFAMVGLLEQMDHIDDYQNPDVLQLPLDTNDFSKNWKINGSGGDVVRGWNRWYYSTRRLLSYESNSDTAGGSSGAGFDLIGDKDAFYLSVATYNDPRDRIVNSCGLFNSSLDSSVIPNWFLTGTQVANAANVHFVFEDFKGATPFISGYTDAEQYFFVATYNQIQRITPHSDAKGIVPDVSSGNTGLYPASLSALEVPFSANQRLRGSLKHICYSGNIITGREALISDNSVYLKIPSGMRATSGRYGGYYFYLGEIE